jgi:hypothetical protein
LRPVQFAALACLCFPPAAAVADPVISPLATARPVVAKHGTSSGSGSRCDAAPHEAERVSVFSPSSRGHGCSLQTSEIVCCLREILLASIRYRLPRRRRWGRGRGGVDDDWSRRRSWSVVDDDRRRRWSRSYNDVVVIRRSRSRDGNTPYVAVGRTFAVPGRCWRTGVLPNPAVHAVSRFRADHAGHRPEHL